MLGVLVAVAAIAAWQIILRVPSTRTRPIATLSTQDVHALLFSPTEPDTVFFGHHGGLLRSPDGGRTWQLTGLRDADAMSLATSPGTPERMYAAGHGVLRRSDDGGRTWTAPAGELQGADIHGFAQNPIDPAQLFALVADRGILISTDGGERWERIAPAPSHGALAVSADGQRLLLGAGSTVQETGDRGVTWQPVGGALPRGSDVTALAVDPTSHTLFAATDHGLYRLPGGVGQWQPLPLAEPMLAVAVSPLQPQVVLAIDAEQRVYRSQDGGSTW